MIDVDKGAICPEWAAAAEETMKFAQTAICRHLGMYHEQFDRDKADAHWLRIYDDLALILDKLNMTTGTKERLAKRNAIAKKIIDELLAKTGQ